MNFNLQYSAVDAIFSTKLYIKCNVKSKHKYKQATLTDMIIYTFATTFVTTYCGAKCNTTFT